MGVGRELAGVSRMLRRRSGTTERGCPGPHTTPAPCRPAVAPHHDDEEKKPEVCLSFTHILPAFGLAAGMLFQHFTKGMRAHHTHELESAPALLLLNCLPLYVCNVLLHAMHCIVQHCEPTMLARSKVGTLPSALPAALGFAGSLLGGPPSRSRGDGLLSLQKSVIFGPCCATSLHGHINTEHAGPVRRLLRPP